MLPAVAHTGGAHAMAGAMLAAPTQAKGSIIWPIGISFVAGTLGALSGGLWPSLISGTAGWLFGEQLR